MHPAANSEDHKPARQFRFFASLSREATPCKAMPISTRSSESSRTIQKVPARVGTLSSEKNPLCRNERHTDDQHVRRLRWRSTVPSQSRVRPHGAAPNSIDFAGSNVGMPRCAAEVRKSIDSSRRVLGFHSERNGKTQRPRHGNSAISIAPEAPPGSCTSHVAFRVQAIRLPEPFAEHRHRQVDKRHPPPDNGNRPAEPARAAAE